MIPYRHDLAIDQILAPRPSLEQNLLRIYTGDSLSEAEARRLWARVADHKWFVSEQLSRDVGFHVAAIDYVENFYRTEPSANQGTAASAARKILGRINRVLENYFVAKSKTLTF